MHKSLVERIFGMIPCLGRRTYRMPIAARTRAGGRLMSTNPTGLSSAKKAGMLP